MGKYTIISEVSEAFLELLRIHLVPEVIPNIDGIALCSPTDRGDVSLGIHLYDVQENDDFRVNEMMPKEVDVQAFPSTYLNLYYMVTAYSGSDVKYRAAEEQRMIGKAIQAIKDCHSLSANIPRLSETSGRYDVLMEMVRLDTEEKMKLWNISNQTYKPSIFYKISPVELESLKEKRIQRVGELDFRSIEKE